MHPRTAPIAAVLALLAALLLGAPPAHADATGTWTNTGTAVGNDCPTTWTGSSAYTLPSASILKVSLAGGGQSNCSVTLRGADLSTWQISLDAGASWTTLSGTFEGFSANSGPTSIWYRVGTTSATLGSGVYSSAFGSGFQNAVVSITPLAGIGSAELTFWLPNGQECTSISPVDVPVDSAYVLPSGGADCRTSAGSQVIGWKVGWDDLIHPPGHTVLVVDSQQFTAVTKEAALSVVFDANVGASDRCLAGGFELPAEYRTTTQTVDRDNLADYRIMVNPICTPPNHYFTGWMPEMGGASVPLGSPAPASWLTTDANTVTLYAQWRAEPVLIYVESLPTDIQAITPVQVMVGDVTPGPGAGASNAITINAPTPPADVLASASPAMTQAINDYFTEGGQALTLVPTGSADAAALIAGVSSVSVPNTLDIAVPEIRELSTTDWLAVAQVLSAKAEDLHAMAWIDPPASIVAVPPAQQAQAVSGLVSLAGQLRSLVGESAIAGTLLSSGVIDASGSGRSASPGAMGIRVSTDINGGEWIDMGPFSGFTAATSELDLTPSQRGDLQMSGVAPVIDFATGQTIVAPAVTLKQWNRTTTVRTDEWLFQSLQAGLRQFSSEPNGPQTRQLMTAAVATFLTTLWQEGALFGLTASDSFSVNCSSTPQQITSDIVECAITVRLSDPSEQTLTLTQSVQPPLASGDGSDQTASNAVSNSLPVRP